MNEYRGRIEDDIVNEYTIHRKTEWKATYKGRWPASDPRGVLVSYYTGVSDHMVRGKDGNYYIGRAVCSPTDSFSRKEGRSRARYWADVAMAHHTTGIPLPTPPLGAPPYHLTEVVVKTHGSKWIVGYAIWRGLHVEWEELENYGVLEDASRSSED